MIQKGGKSIASGSYGCVFRPSLKCIDENKRSSDSVSKLMLDKDAKKEFEEINKYKDTLEKIPNYKKYFIVADDLCKPDTLTNDDVVDIDKKCDKYPFVDKLLKELPKPTSFSSVQIPDGGNDLYNHYSKTQLDYKAMFVFNNLLQNISKNAIIPMNKLKLIHGDIKSDNFLIDKNGEIKLIDWGLAMNHKNGLSSIHGELEWRPLSINAPPSIIIFSNYFLTKINFHLKSILISNSKINKKDLHDLILHNYQDYESKYGEGHREQITAILNFIIKYSSLKIKPPVEVITDYITECIYNYIKYVKLLDSSINMYFDYNEYFDKVFSHNYDRFGIVMTYVRLIEILESAPDRFILKNKYTIDQLKKVFADFLYKHLYLKPTKIIDMNNVFKDAKKFLSFFDEGDRLTNLITLEENKMISNKRLVDTDVIDERLKSINSLNDNNKKGLVKKSKKRIVAGSKKTKKRKKHKKKK